MVKRMVIVTSLLIAFLAGGILAQSCSSLGTQGSTKRPSITPTAMTQSLAQPPLDVPVERIPHPTPTAATERLPTTSPDRPAVWILGPGDRFIALDTETGHVLNQTGRVFGWRIAAHAGRSEYFLQAEDKDHRWHVGLAAINPQRGTMARPIPLDSFPATALTAQEDLEASALISKDNRALVTLVERIGGKWVTVISVVDLSQNAAAPPVTVFETKTAEYAPPVSAVLSGDGKRLFIAQNFQEPNLGDKANGTLWSTRVAVLNIDGKQVERIADVSGEIQADGFWLDGVLSQDARLIYLVQNIVRGNEDAGYRFVAFDANKLAVANSGLVEGSELFCLGDGLRSTPDGRYFWGACNNAFQFLDVQTGRVTQKVQIKRHAAVSDFDPWYTLVSPDKRLVYLVYPVAKEFVAFDLTRRAVVGQAVISESKFSYSNPLQWLAQFLVPTANAKFFAQPGAVLSPDGQRLYFVDVTGMDSGDGIWGIETNSFKPLGHWLKGKDIVGVQLSEDGDELFAVGLKDHALSVLDAFSGEIRRSFDLGASQPFGFVAVE